MKKIIYLLICSLAFLLQTLCVWNVFGEATPAIIEEMPVERLDLQAKLIKTVMKFSSRKLEQMRIGIVYVPETTALAQRLTLEIEKLRHNQQPIEVSLIESEHLERLKESVNVLYITPGNQQFLDRIVDIAAEKKMFSCTGVPEYVKKSKVALGFDNFQAKPQILLNLMVAKQADHEFKNPKFLNLQSTRKLILIK